MYSHSKARIRQRAKPPVPLWHLGLPRRISPCQRLRIRPRSALPISRLRSRQILRVLEEPILKSFPNDTPLDDVLKYIEQAPTTPAFTGIPIYVDPIPRQGVLQTIRFDENAKPLKTSLAMILRQLGLAYIVKDGLLLIDSGSSINAMKVEEIDRKLVHVLESLKTLENLRAR